MKTYFYDIEIFPNFFSVTFIDMEVNANAVKQYCIADYTGNKKDKEIILSKVINPYIFIIIDSHNDMPLLLDFMTTHKTIIGYNNINYDDIILDWLIVNYKRYNKYGLNKDKEHINKSLFNLSQSIINYGNGYRYLLPELKYYKRPYYSKDLQKLLYLDKRFISLKQVAVQLKWYRLQDLPLPFNKDIDPKLIPEIIDYNVNDVLITRELFYNQITEINLRESITHMYGVNVRTDSRSGTANKLIMNFYSSETGLPYKEFKDERTYRRYIDYKDIISPKIQFKTQILKDFLSSLKYKGLLVGVDKFSETVIFDDKGYTFATGGIHSVDYPNVYNSTEDYTIRDCDVGSFYPRIILNERIAPKHLNTDIFLKILEMVTEDRLKAKVLTKDLKGLPKSTKDVSDYIEIYNNKAEALKIVINATYGKLGDENSFLYDLKAMYSVTINGQLYLLMLIEMLSLIGIKCISANTDGIVCIVPKDKEDIYYKTCKEWEDKTKFTLEYTDYEKYVCYAVNDYIAIKKGYNNSNKSDSSKKEFIKEKGLFITTTQIDKGYNSPVVAKALVSYYADGTPVEEFIKNHDDIYDFCISIKTGMDFIKEYHYVEDRQHKIDILQKNVRYYISNTGGMIMKRYREVKVDKRGVKREYISLHKRRYSTIFNDYEVHFMPDYNINYNYYIGEAYKIINGISNIIHKKQNKQSYGGLFDEL